MSFSLQRMIQVLIIENKIMCVFIINNRTPQTKLFYMTEAH